MPGFLWNWILPTVGIPLAFVVFASPLAAGEGNISYIALVALAAFMTPIQLARICFAFLVKLNA